jgi:hypothetical protein
VVLAPHLQLQVLLSHTQAAVAGRLFQLQPQLEPLEAVVKVLKALHHQPQV